MEDADAAPGSLLEKGSVRHGEVRDKGGIRVATVLDPDGNGFGIIENPCFSLSGS